MNQNPLPSSSKIPHRQPPEPERAWVWVLIAIAGLGLVGFVGIAGQNVIGRSQELADPAVEAKRAPASPAAGGTAKKKIRSRSDRDSTESGHEAASPTVEEPSPDAKELVKTLTEVRPGALTPAAAEAWQRNLTKLLGLGTAAVPALTEFFNKHEDVRFDAGPGPNLLGESSLRIAFLKVLFDIPGPANVELQARVLKTATDPDEIALIARQLEQQEPGKYEDMITEAARESLEIARNGELPGRDTRPLVELLTKYVGPDGK